MTQAFDYIINIKKGYNEKTYKLKCSIFVNLDNGHHSKHSKKIKPNSSKSSSPRNVKASKHKRHKSKYMYVHIIY